MRLVVAALVEVAIAAVVAQPGAVPAPVAVATLVLAPDRVLGLVPPPAFARTCCSSSPCRSRCWPRSGSSCGDVRSVTSFDQARIPLASLFLWVQVLHAFDVPRRRDLSFSVVSSLILMAEAGSLSLSTSFALFVLVWAALAGAWLSLSSRPRPDQVAAAVAVRRHAPERSAPRWAPIRSAAASAGLALLAASLVFLAMPRLPGSFVRTPPFSLAGNPAADRGVRRRRSRTRGCLPTPGRRDRLLVGRLSRLQRRGGPAGARATERRARVPGARATAGAVASRGVRPLRRLAVDDHRRRDGEPARNTRTACRTPCPAAIAMRNDAIGLDSSKVVQTFYIEAAQPNVLFAASSARQVYFPSAGLRVDRRRIDQIPDPARRGTRLLGDLGGAGHR